MNKYLLNSTPELFDRTSYVCGKVTLEGKYHGDEIFDGK
jgi:hypothetical protein